MRARNLLPCLLLLGLARPSPAEAECATRFPVSRLEEGILMAEVAFPRSPIDFQSLSIHVGEMLACMDEVLTPSAAAKVHRIVGLQAFSAGDTEYAHLAFIAARELDPGFTYRPGVIPHEHPAYLAYLAAVPNIPVKLQVLPAPESGTLVLDGIPGRDRPVHRPSVLQWLDDDGTVLRTDYVWPDEDGFGYPVAAVPFPPEVAAAPTKVPASVVTPPKTAIIEPLEVPPADLPPGSAVATLPTPAPAHTDLKVAAPKSGVAWPRVLGISSGAAAASAIVCYAMGWRIASDYTDEERTTEEYQSLQNSNHALIISSGVLGGLAVGAGAGALVTWRF